MATDYYSLKEVLLAFREEYQKNARELAVLKKYVKIVDRHLGDLNFHMRSRKGSTEDLQLFCSYIENKNQLQQYIEMLSKKMKFRIHRINIGKVFQDANGIYQINGHYKTEITDNSSFAHQVEEIKKSNFVKEFSQNTIRVNKNNIEHILEQDISELDAFRQEYNDYTIGVSYDPVNDTIAHIDFQHSKQCPEHQMLLLDALYDIKYPKEVFSSYQQQIIEKSTAAKKEILIEKDAQNIYSIDDKENKAVILRKVKR